MMKYLIYLHNIILLSHIHVERISLTLIDNDDMNSLDAIYANLVTEQIRY